MGAGPKTPPLDSDEAFHYSKHRTEGPDRVPASNSSVSACMLRHTHASFSRNLCLNPSWSTVGAVQGLMPALDLSSKPVLEVQDLSTEASGERPVLEEGTLYSPSATLG